MRNKNNQTMVRLALLVALEILLALTPLGYLKAGVIEISLLMLPVTVGGILLGPGAGAFLGGVFGLTSFFQCFGTSAFGAALLGISGIGTFIVCVPTRILAGWGAALLYRLLQKRGKATAWTKALSCFAGSLLNTLLFVGVLIALFGNADVVGFASSGMNVFAFFAAFVGINALVELPLNTLVGSAVATALEKVLARKH